MATSSADSQAATRDFANYPHPAVRKTSLRSSRKLVLKRTVGLEFTGQSPQPLVLGAPLLRIT